MKLKCEEHRRRVVTVNEDKFVHRSDGSECWSFARIGNFIGPPFSVVHHLNPTAFNAPTRCHCGNPANSTNDRLPDFCQTCSDTRCDAFPSECPRARNSQAMPWDDKS